MERSDRATGRRMLTWLTSETGSRLYVRAEFVACAASYRRSSSHTIVSTCSTHTARPLGKSNVCHAPIEDYHLCDHRTLEDTILPFLAASDASGTRPVVHCSGGLGRTGHILAAWLVRHRGLSVDDALEIVSRERNPREAVGSGHATEKELRCLLAGKTSGASG